MTEWWEALTAIQKGFALVAVPATLLLVLQTILLLIGLGHGDADADLDLDDASDGPDFDDADVDLDGGFRLFTVRGIVAFFAVMGWTGLALMKGGVDTSISIILAFAAGSLALFLMALAMRGFARLQNDGTMDIRNALGVSGTVYITVPPARSERGKVNIVLQNQLGEFDAVTDEETPLKYGTEIVVIGISGTNTLVVKKK